MGRMLPLITAISLSMATTLQAETLEMPTESAAPAPAATDYSVTLPGRGMNMTQVEEKFGPPLHKLPEVGDPPIIRWVYPNYTVYFEYQFVINSVLNSAAGAPVPQSPEVEAPAETAPIEGLTPVDPASEAEIIPSPEAPMPAAEVEAPAPVVEPEAEVVIPSEAPATSQ
ncbi:MAG: hypothetical protein OEU74_03925 [Gammaproteobacteria bacterium]|nr:hypothetical protein [Gammaproteobacteria bacterium]